MTTALLTHPACLAHEVPAGHPESPARLRAVLGALDGPAFSALHREEAPRAAVEVLERVHPYAVKLLAAIPAQGLASIDADTAVSPGSGEAAERAAGAVIRAVDLVMDGRVQNAFCAVRPPGHHAEPEMPMGFCLFNNIASAPFMRGPRMARSASRWWISTSITATAPRPLPMAIRSSSKPRRINRRFIPARAPPPSMASPAIS
jgi:hypothetical protein